MIHRAIKVEFEKKTKVRMTFQDGKVKLYDMARLFERYPQVRKLEDWDVFRRGKLNAYGVIWDDEIDIDSDTVYECGENAGEVQVPIKTVVAYAVTEARQSAGLSQAKLAEKTMIDQADISKIECGLANPSIGTLERIARALNMELSVGFKEGCRGDEGGTTGGIAGGI